MASNGSDLCPNRYDVPRFPPDFQIGMMSPDLRFAPDLPQIGMMFPDFPRFPDFPDFQHMQ